MIIIIIDITKSTYYAHSIRMGNECYIAVSNAKELSPFLFLSASAFSVNAEPWNK